MFLIILLPSWTALCAYVFWRAASVPVVERTVSRRALAAVAALVWLAVILSAVIGHDASGPLGSALELLGMSGLAALFLLAVCLVVVDLVTGFGLLLPRLAPRLRGGALLAGLVLIAIANVQGLRPPVVRRYEVRLVGLPASADGTTVVVVSDLHLGSVLGQRWLAARVGQVEALTPDILVLLGDITEGHGGSPAAELLPELRRLSARLGVWAVTGNHESHRRDRASSLLLEDAGFRVLHDRWAEVGPGIVLAGVDDRTRDGGPALEQALRGRPPGPTVLLSHAPDQVRAAARSGVGLVLCGHTHGGQIWPFSELVRLFYPMLGGRYEVEGVTVIVCRGTGTWGPRMRLWRPSEILRVTLHQG